MFTNKDTWFDHIHFGYTRRKVHLRGSLFILAKPSKSNKVNMNKLWPRFCQKGGENCVFGLDFISFWVCLCFWYYMATKLFCRLQNILTKKRCQRGRLLRQILTSFLSVNCYNILSCCDTVACCNMYPDFWNRVFSQFSFHIYHAHICRRFSGQYTSHYSVRQRGKFYTFWILEYFLNQVISFLNSLIW